MILKYLDKIPRQITRIYLDTLLKSNFLKGQIYRPNLTIKQNNDKKDW